MSSAVVVDALIIRAQHAASVAVAARKARLVAAVAVDLPGVTAHETSDGVELTGPGLRGRGFGTRIALRDVRLLAFVEDHR